MQEIARGIYLETAFPGVTLGAISLTHGLVLVDAPLRADDARIWRSMLLNLGSGVDRLLVNLDAHIDRTLGTRAMECTVVAHEKTALIFRSRPPTFKAQGAQTGAEWEQLGGLGSVRWALPELTFTQSIVTHWGDNEIHLEYHPGPNPGAIWVVIPAARVAFIGDAAIPDQPPFLANANLPAWIETLGLLLSPAYQDYLLVGGRSGLVPQEQLRRQTAYLREVSQMVARKEAQKVPAEIAAEDLIAPLLRLQEFPAAQRELYTHRLRWGLRHYFNRGRHSSIGEEESGTI